MKGYPGDGLMNEMAGAFAEMLSDEMSPEQAITMMSEVEEEDWFWARINDIINEIKETE